MVQFLFTGRSRPLWPVSADGCCQRRSRYNVPNPSIQILCLARRLTCTFPTGYPPGPEASKQAALHFRTQAVLQHAHIKKQAM